MAGESQRGALPPASFFRALAHRLNPSTTKVDFEGKTREDYEQDLYAHALAVSATRPAPTHFYMAVLRNKASDAHRMRKRRKACTFRLWVGPLDADTEDAVDVPRPREAPVDPMAHLETRACIRLLERRLSRRDKRVLQAYAETDHWEEAQARLKRPPGTEGNDRELAHSTFGAHLKQAKQNALAILGGDR